jgi:hypothetical protein
MSGDMTRGEMRGNLARVDVRVDVEVRVLPIAEGLTIEQSAKSEFETVVPAQGFEP